ncbi:MAG: PilZ domain-containing protein, partial [Deltaproteobacteria bacterium]|nr:PilZ domain-containing protein [Deltaproteobacteria bacterium]
LCTLFMIVILVFAVLIRYGDRLGILSPGAMKEMAFLSPLLSLFALLIQIFVLFLLLQNKKYRRLRKESFIQRMKLPKMVGREEEATVLLKIGAELNSLKDLSSLMELILKESLRYLKGHRATVFLMDVKSGILKGQYAQVSAAEYEQVESFEEKELARKILKQRRPSLLRDAKDFSDFFKHEEKDRKIDSLLSAPLFVQAKPIGALSIVRVDEKIRFNDKDLEFFSILSQFVSMAIEKAYLVEEIQKGLSFRKGYEKYLDDILNQLESLSDEERQRIEEHIVSLLPRKSYNEKQLAEPSGEGKGTEKFMETPMAKEGRVEQRMDERVDGMTRVEIGDEFLGFGDDLSIGGIFIRTPNPLDLGEQFLLKVHLDDGKDPVEVPCKVIWTNKYGKESKNLRRGMGLKFINLPPDIQKRLENYMRRQESKISAAGGRKPPGEIRGKEKG